MAVTAFGAQAQEVARRLPALTHDVIVADAAGAHYALVEAYGRRARGQAFRAMILLDEETSELGRQVSQHIITHVRERHERLRTLGARVLSRPQPFDSRDRF